MSELSAAEQREFFAQLGFPDGDGTLVERRDGGHIVALDGRPPGCGTEYRNGSSVQSAQTMNARMRRLEELCSQIDEVLAKLPD